MLDCLPTSRLRLLLSASALAVACQAGAAPHAPASDDQVLERLPFRANDPVAREMSALRRALQKDPQNLDVAVKLARRYYELVGEEGDPRYLGYAEAALRPWWSLEQPPTSVQVLRASLKQFRHDFDGAVDDLNKVLEREPDNSAARALRAIIHIVQARYAAGRVDCTALRKSGDPLIGQACEAMVDGLTGRAAPAYQSLLAAYREASGKEDSQRMWVLIRLGELAWRQGDLATAETHFKEAVGLGISDTFLLAAYADLLIEQKRYNDVLALLKDKSRSDVLLLRIVLAEHALKLPAARQREAELAARYAAAQMRGDTVHQQEESRFALQVNNDVKSALALAAENWKVQREPRDAQVFLEAAVAANDAATAAPVLAWLQESHIEDKTLIGLGRKLKGERP
ncbi:tetratricopeptide repeat protein [Noviherbaspirillum galbum]|uniref:Tetratricopeptide repeat protein n=1 Tax=Noviherbaspirillum galbum TaxID=2709383 RepID=A0A6B3SPT0_9BURK|nr:hypothetical protein [Noviherbaspirillum galbum]NEX60412.1 hypothetical protein [Noviherbaspirillum galbum]